MRISWRDDEKKFEKSWRKEGKGYKAEVGNYEMVAVPVRLPVPPNIGLLEIIKRGGLPKGWKWSITIIRPFSEDVTFSGYSTSLDEAKYDLKDQLHLFREGEQKFFSSRKDSGTECTD